MSTLSQKNIGSAVRAAILLLGFYGIEITPDDQATLLRGLEMLINGALIVFPLLWSFYKNWSDNHQIESAQLMAELSQRRG